MNQENLPPDYRDDIQKAVTLLKGEG